jgi:hypothetical protein
LEREIMSKRSIEEARDPDLRGSLPALRRAALRAREIARKSGTAVVIWRNNRIEYLKPEGRRADTDLEEDEKIYRRDES